MEKSLIERTNEALEATKGKYLTVYLNEQLYGIPVFNVVQIVGVQDIVPVPEFPHYAKGVMNLRGSIIPVIDMRLRLGMMEADYTDRTCIIITNVRERYIGFIVDSVDEVTDIPDEEILPTPHVEQAQNEYVDGVCKRGDKIVLRLALGGMLNDGDISSMYSAGY